MNTHEKTLDAGWRILDARSAGVIEKTEDALAIDERGIGADCENPQEKFAQVAKQINRMKPTPLRLIQADIGVQKFYCG